MTLPKSSCSSLAIAPAARSSSVRGRPFFVQSSAARSLSIVIYGDHMTTKRISGETVNRTVKRAAEAAGLGEMGFTAHSLRSGYITHSFQKGKIAETIQQQTGHESVNTVAGYNRRARALGPQSPTVGMV